MEKTDTPTVEDPRKFLVDAAAKMPATINPGQESLIRITSTLANLFEDCKNYGKSAFSRRVAYAVQDLQLKTFDLVKELNNTRMALGMANGQLLGLKTNLAEKESDLKKQQEAWQAERAEQSKFKNRLKNLFIKPKH